jgi:hypothetical protein
VLIVVLIAGVWAEAWDGLTRFLMPDVFELNPVSVHLGQWGSLGVKVGLIGAIVWVTLWLARMGHERYAYAVALVALVAGSVGTVSNLAVLR